jgi:hypothetical protein
VDEAGKIVREVKVASEPEALLAVLKNLAYHFKTNTVPACLAVESRFTGKQSTRLLRG